MSIAEKFEVIADAVYDKGIDDGVIKLWDAMTAKGEKATCIRTFNETDFTDMQELPYVWKPSSGNFQYAFYNYRGTKLPNPKYLDLSALPLNENTNHSAYFCASWSSTLTKEGVFPDYGIPARNFYDCWFTSSGALKTIEILRTNENTSFKDTFRLTLNLENITFEGVIGKNIDFKDCPLLTIESLNNIIDHLKEFPTENSANITLHADSKALLGTEGLARILAKGWSYA